MKISDMTHNGLCKALLPIITRCYFSNRQKLDRGDSMELVTSQVASDVLRLRPTATMVELAEAFERGAAGDYEADGKPPYLTPNNFRYFVKKYYESRQGVNMQHDEETQHALPYFSSWEERQVYHLLRRYEDMSRGLVVLWFDADILFRFLKQSGLATDDDYSTEAMIARARHQIIAEPAADKPLAGGIAKSIEKRLSSYDTIAAVAMGIFIEELMRGWIRQGMSAEEVASLLRGNMTTHTNCAEGCF